jgi:hypothetical protein
MFESLKQGGHQFAPGQIACAAKENKVKTHGWFERFAAAVSKNKKPWNDCNLVS